MSKRSGNTNPSGERKRKALSIEEKLEIIKRFERNERTCDISRATGLSESTLRTIKDNAARIKGTCIAGTIVSTAKSIRTRPREIEEMERLLSVWIEDQTKKRSGTSFLSIKAKALAIYDDLREVSPNPSEVLPFSASSGWFSGFKRRYSFHNITLTGDGPSADEEAADTFPPVLQKFIQEEGYTMDQIFSFDETGLYWKRMPSKTCISKMEAHAPGFKAAKDRVTVMLGANASGDLKMKPAVVYHSFNPRALKGIVKSSLGVHFRSSRRGWMTGQIFTDLLANVYHDVFKNYCKKKKLDFKILIISDNTPSHPPMVAELSPNIKVIFLPPNTASLLQPLDQGVIAAFKAYYLRETFKMLIAATEDANAQSVLEFWKRFNIKLAIDIIVEAWNDVTKECLHRVWRKLLPDLIHDFLGFEPSNELIKIKASCVALAKQVGFEEVEIEDIEELLLSHSEDLSTQDLQQLVAEGQVGGADDDDQSAPRELSTLELSSALTGIEKHLQWIEDNDYNAERSRIALRGIRAHLEPYKQLTACSVAMRVCDE